LRSGCAHWDLDCEEEAAGEEAEEAEEAEEEENSSVYLTTLTWQVGKKPHKSHVSAHLGSPRGTSLQSAAPGAFAPCAAWPQDLEGRGAGDGAGSVGGGAAATWP